jgi:AcrR family transcriptional regulator
MSRGRPRKTDPDKALEAAMHAFWEKGYAGTTMSDLVAATGMAKPGLYANFGDKEALYQKALTHYFTELGSPLIEEMLASDDPLEVNLRRFLMLVAHSVTGNGTPKGCFIVNSAFDCSDAEPQLKELSQTYNVARRDAFVLLLEKAQARGELPENVGMDALASFYAGQSAALAAMARSGAGMDDLEAMVDLALQVLPKSRV